MSDRLKCAGQLNKLLESNFFVAKCYRKMKSSVKEESLQTFFQKKASKRFQFAIELSEEIGFLKESFCSYGPFSSLRRNHGISEEEHLSDLLEKAINNDQKILEEYRKAISGINEGSTREILIRHISIIEKSLQDLRAMKAANTAAEHHEILTDKNTENYEIY